MRISIPSIIVASVAVTFLASFSPAVRPVAGFIVNTAVALGTTHLASMVGKSTVFVIGDSRIAEAALESGENGKIHVVSIGRAGSTAEYWVNHVSWLASILPEETLLVVWAGINDRIDHGREAESVGADLLRIGNIARQNGLRILVLHQFSLRTEDQYWVTEVNRIIDGIHADGGSGTLPDALSVHAVPKIYASHETGNLFRDQIHLNENGNRIIQQVLHEYVEKVFSNAET